MNRRKMILAAIAGFIVIAAIAVGYRWFASEPPLFVSLRCNGEVSGKLNAAIIKQDGEAVRNESFDVKTVCQAGKFELNGYDRDKKLQFTLERGNGEKINLVSEYGSDIMRDPNEFNMILKITDAPPFIANDRL